MFIDLTITTTKKHLQTQIQFSFYKEENRNGMWDRGRLKKFKK